MALDFSFSTTWYVYLSIVLFGVGLMGVLTQKSGIRILMCIEMMLNAANINFVAFSSHWAESTGYAYALFIIAIAAAEAAVGLAIFVNLWRVRQTIDLDQVKSLRW